MVVVIVGIVIDVIVSILNHGALISQNLYITYLLN